jgi:putative transposase
MPRVRFGEREYFHVFNRGVEKRLIFMDDKDRWRFMTLLIVVRGDAVFNQISRLVSAVEHRRFDIAFLKEILKKRHVELVSFCLMPNHFHLILRESRDGGISKFMQRLADAYTKYFNLRHNRSGHLFGGKFQSVHIDRNEYLNYLSAYIHLNPKELRKWHGKEIYYPWSSFQDFSKENRWGPFLNSSVIRDQFKSGVEYQKFVEETPIKERLGNKYLLDR